jgi:hypothetical protein
MFDAERPTDRETVRYAVSSSLLISLTVLLVSQFPQALSLCYSLSATDGVSYTL